MVSAATQGEIVPMKTLIVFDSIHGNTAKIAAAVGEVIGEDVHVVPVSTVTFADLKSVDLFIIGSPTHGGRPTQSVQGFLKGLQVPDGEMRAAVFDTRMPAKWVRIFGYAAQRMAGTLRAKGWVVVEPVEGFFVKGREGPLQDGELQRAAAWAKAIEESVSKGA
jgi:flavodoxin I